MQTSPTGLKKDASESLSMASQPDQLLHNKLAFLKRVSNSFVSSTSPLPYILGRVQITSLCSIKSLKYTVICCGPVLELLQCFNTVTPPSLLHSPTDGAQAPLVFSPIP